MSNLSSIRKMAKFTRLIFFFFHRKDETIQYNIIINRHPVESFKLGINENPLSRRSAAELWLITQTTSKVQMASSSAVGRHRAHDKNGNGFPIVRASISIYYLCSFRSSHLHSVSNVYIVSETRYIISKQSRCDFKENVI